LLIVGLVELNMKAEKVKNQRKNKRIFLLTGIILILIGIILAMTLFQIITINPQQIKNDEDLDNYGWKSYDPGDEIIINGKITEEKIFYDKGEREFGYILNNYLRISSTNDLGDKGDNIIVICEIKEMSTPSINNGTPFEYFKVKSTINPFLLFLPGVIIFIIGILIICSYYFNLKRNNNQSSS